ncbi:MAG: prephenate dehydrogenase [Candidatus Omnitrophota bacterium]
MKIKKVVIIGMGLIGGSLGKALLEKNIADQVIGVCRRQVSLDKAIKEKSLTAGCIDKYKEVVKDAQIIVIATPVSKIKKILTDLAEVLNDPKIIVTDVGSTKEEIVRYAGQFKNNFSFVGAHPLAGSEKKGVEHSDGSLFENSVCIVTPTNETLDENYERVKSLWEKTGARIVRLEPKIHDEYLAFSSHLPHIVAYALAGALGENFSKDMVATGFKDTTRIALSDPELWKDIFMSNKQNVINAIARVKEILSGIEEDLALDKEAELVKKLKKYKGIRDEYL